MVDNSFYSRNLPHWQPSNSVFFITFRLAFSLPADVITQLDLERSRDVKSSFGQAWQFFDDWLDLYKGEASNWLADVAVASVVEDEIKRLDGVRFSLLAFCIMPNHVHLLVDTSELEQNTAQKQEKISPKYPLAMTMQIIKGRSSRYCNRILGRSGTFWQSESYDHVIRDEKEFDRVLFYIVNNPVKAGLVAEWDLWPFTYIKTVLW